MEKVEITKEQAEIIKTLANQQAQATQNINLALLAVLAGHNITKFKDVQLNENVLTFEKVE